MDEHRDSLADQAAAWVPPWERKQPTPVPPADLDLDLDTDAEPASAPEPDSAAEPEAAIVAEPEAEPSPEPEAAIVAEPEAEPSPEPEAAIEAEPEAEPESESVVPVRAVPVPSRETMPETALALIDDAELRAALESILLVVDEPVGEMLLAQILEQPTERIAGTLAELSAEYTSAGRGIDLRRAAGGWRMYTRAEYAPYVERFILDGQQTRLTQAALETLAVIAYKQPVTRSRISAIRGVNCDGVIRTLVNRGLVEECGSEPDSGAYLYRTTTLFLEKLGLDSVAELPSLAPFLPDDVEEIADAQR